MTASTNVNNLPIPRSLVAAIESGQWCRSRSLAGIEALGVIYPEDLTPFDLRQMTVVTDDLRKLAVSEEAETYRVFMSSNELDDRENWLNATKAVVIAGGVSEEMLCLKYRESMTRPIVVSQDCESLRWKVIFNSIEELLDYVWLNNSNDVP